MNGSIYTKVVKTVIIAGSQVYFLIDHSFEKRGNHCRYHHGMYTIVFTTSKKKLNRLKS